VYSTHQCLYRFDLVSHADEERVPVQKFGNVRVSVAFSKPLTEGATLILINKFADKFHIDRERNVFQGA